MPANNPKPIEVSVVSSRIVKPTYGGDPPSTTLYIPLTVFDRVVDDTHMAVIYAFRPPTPPNATIERGLAAVLSEYREFAGRLGTDAGGGNVILLNDAGVRFVEASAGFVLDMAMPLEPSLALSSLYPPLDRVEEPVQVQLTRFTCGSLVLGFTSHHRISDGHAASSFLVAWGRVARGLPVDPLPLHERSMLFVPRDPPRIEFEHRGAEYVTKKKVANIAKDDVLLEEIAFHKAHFTKEFLTKLKATASFGAKRPCTTFESLVAHLWRVVTRARGLDGHETTYIRIAVDGRARLSPRVPDEYFGNLVLWAFPRIEVSELINWPLQHAVELIRGEVAKVSDKYFRSFIDFASSGTVEKEGLVPNTDNEEWMLSPNLEVNSWLRFPFYDVDFGGGCPYYFMPGYVVVEGVIYLMPPIGGEGVEVYVSLFSRHLLAFKRWCYSLEKGSESPGPQNARM